MKKLLLLINVSLLYFSSIGQQSKGDKITDDYLNQNIAFTKIEKRNLESGLYLVEISVKDFNKSESLPVGFGLKGLAFSDDGKKNDLKANDGIYTSTTALNLSEKQSDILGRQIVGSSFQYYQELYLNSSSNNVNHLLQVSQVYSIFKCKFKKCGCPCPQGSCPACEWFGWQCWEVTECEIGL